jgi:phasin family protein
VDNQAETKPQPETEVASSPAVVAVPKAIAETAPVKAEPVKPVKQPKKAKAKARARKPIAAVTAKVAKLNARQVNKARRPAGRKPAGPRIERTNTMTFDATKMFTQFDALPGADKFQTLFAEAGERSQDLVRKSQKAAEQLAEIAKANVEALTEAGRIATSGARTIGQDALANSRTGIEQATAAVKTLAEAKSPTEFFQLQSELLRTSFDRAVADGSKLTEQLVKLAGETVQPLSTRASLNAERINELTA